MKLGGGGGIMLWACCSLAGAEISKKRYAAAKHRLWRTTQRKGTHHNGPVTVQTSTDWKSLLRLEKEQVMLLLDMAIMLPIIVNQHFPHPREILHLQPLCL